MAAQWGTHSSTVLQIAPISPSLAVNAKRFLRSAQCDVAGIDAVECAQFTQVTMWDADDV